MSRQGLVSSTMVGYVSSKPRGASGYEFLQLDDEALVFEGRVYSPIPKTSVMEQVAKEPHHCEALLQKLIAEADGDYSFLIAQGRLDCGGKRPSWGSTALLRRKPKHRRHRHKPKSPLETGNRKPRFFSAWKHGFCEP